MLSQGAHVFSHQTFGHAEPAWLTQQHHPQTHHQVQAAAAAHASAAHYNRIQATHNQPGPSHLSIHGQDSSMMDGVTEENRRVLGWIADLLSEDTREAALLELSKKREQVPELALILWHSFGEFCAVRHEKTPSNISA
jgi:CCR4-NOT transcription complex subunit 9